MEGGGEGGDGEEGERSDEIGRDLGVENITLKARLHWYGHILRMEEGNKVKQNIKMEVRGTPAKGRPRMRWMDNIRHDITKCGLEEGDAQDRRRWRRMVQNRDLASQLDKGEQEVQTEI